jgi:hypothetical protein
MVFRLLCSSSAKNPVNAGRPVRSDNVAFESDIYQLNYVLFDKAGEFAFEWKRQIRARAFTTPSLRIGFNRDRNFPS